jgi:hypothetical protein
VHDADHRRRYVGGVERQQRHAVFGSLNASKGAQIAADRSALAGADPYATGQLLGSGAGSPGRPSTGFLAAYQALTAQVTTQTYANGFFVVAILGVVGAVLALFMRSGGQKGGGAREAVEM